MMRYTFLSNSAHLIPDEFLHFSGKSIFMSVGLLPDPIVTKCEAAKLPKSFDQVGGSVCISSTPPAIGEWGS